MVPDTTGGHHPSGSTYCHSCSQRDARLHEHLTGVGIPIDDPIDAGQIQYDAAPVESGIVVAESGPASRHTQSLFARQAEYFRDLFGMRRPQNVRGGAQ